MTYIKQNAMHVEMQSTSLVVSIGAVKNHENTPAFEKFQQQQQQEQQQ